MRRLLVSAVLAAVCARPLAAETMLYAIAAADNRIDGYRVRDDGSFALDPAKQRTTIGARPRRVITNGCTLYVAEIDRVEVYHIGDGGQLTLIGATRKSTDSKPRDMALSTDGHTLYVPSRHTGSLASYPLDVEGKPTDDVVTQDGVPAGGPSSCVYAPNGADWEDIVFANGRVYGTATDRVSIYGTDDAGRLTSVAEKPLDLNHDGTIAADEMGCPAYAPTASGTIQDCVDFTMMPKPTRPVNCPLSFRNHNGGGVGLVVEGTTLVTVQRLNKWLQGFTLGADGLFPPYGLDPENPTNKEKKAERKSRKKNRTSDALKSYIGLTLFHPVGSNPVVYAASTSGSIEAFRLSDTGTLPKRVMTSTGKDVISTPIRTTVGLFSNGPMLYVAGGELDRVESFRLSSQGAIVPDSRRLTNELTDSFPNDVVLSDITNCH